VTSPGARARTVTVNAAASPPASAGRVQVAVLGSRVQAGAHDVGVRFGGNRMLAVTVLAVAGPALATATWRIVGGATGHPRPG